MTKIAGLSPQVEAIQKLIAAQPTADLLIIRKFIDLELATR